LDRVIARHPETTFVRDHFANNAEDLDWVAQSLETHTNAPSLKSPVPVNYG